MSIFAGIENKLRGQVRFPQDMSETHSLKIRIVRSEIQQGNILSLFLPPPDDQIELFFPEDIPGDNCFQLQDCKMPLLTADRIDYAGQALFLIASTHEDLMDSYLEKIKINYQSNSEIKKTKLLQKTINIGQSDDFLTSASITVYQEYQTPQQSGFTPSPASVFVVPDKGEIYIYCQTQWPSLIRDNVASVLNQSKKSVHVIATGDGPSLDTLLWHPAYLACLASLISWKTDKPALLSLPRIEDLLFTPRRAAVNIKLNSAMNDEGLLKALKAKIEIDCGAYPFFMKEILDQCVLGLSGIYACRNTIIEAEVLSSPSYPCGPFCGYGIASSFFAIESQMEQMAELCGLGSDLLRLRNLPRDFDKLLLKKTEPSYHPAYLLIKRVITLADYKRKYAAYTLLKKRSIKARKGMPLKGIGLAASYQPNSFLSKELNAASLKVTLEADGILSIETSAVFTNPFLQKYWKDMASRVLEIPLDKIRIHWGIAIYNLDSGPSTSSRNLSHLTRLLEQGLQAISKKRFHSALPISAKRSYKRPQSYTWDDDNFHGTAFPSKSWGAAVVELELDPASLEIQIKKVSMVIDAGPVLNRKKAISEVKSSVLLSIGWLICEFPPHDIIADPFNSMHYFQIPNLRQEPEINVDFIESDKKSKPRGLGEIASNCIPAAIVNALSQACGKRITSFPITGETFYTQEDER